MTARRMLAVAQAGHPGGAEIILMRLLGALGRRGWDITLTTPAPGPLRTEALEAGWTMHELPVGGLAARAGARAVASFPAIRRLASDADVIWFNGGAAARLLPAVSRRRRTVIFVVDVVERVPPHWKRADLVLAVSDAAAEAVQELDPVTIGVAVDPDPPHVVPPWKPNGRPVIGFVGRIEPRKAPLDLVQAAPSIRAQVPDARIVVVGDDPYGSDPEYLAAVDAAEGIERHGWSEEAPGLMRHLDVLVMPSRREALGAVAVEAMAVGTPVVATNVDGIGEAVEDGVSGRLVAPGDTDGLAAAVVEVLGARERMGAAGRERAKRFHTDTVAAEVERLMLGDAA